MQRRGSRKLTKITGWRGTNEERSWKIERIKWRSSSITRSDEISYPLSMIVWLVTSPPLESLLTRTLTTKGRRYLLLCVWILLYLDLTLLLKNTSTPLWFLSSWRRRDSPTSYVALLRKSSSSSRMVWERLASSSRTSSNLWSQVFSRRRSDQSWIACVVNDPLTSIATTGIGLAFQQQYFIDGSRHFSPQGEKLSKHAHCSGSSVRVPWIVLMDVARTLVPESLNSSLIPELIPVPSSL